jgi:F-type H+-transporting ATPase subunit epsilon
MLKLKVVTPTDIVLEELVENVSIPTTGGVITVLNRHIPLVSPIKHGEVVIRKEGTERGYVVHSGVVNVRPQENGTTEVVLLIEDAALVEGEDESVRVQALVRARELAHMKEEDVDFGTFESAIERELSQVKFTKRR